MKSLAWIALALVPAASAGTVTFPVGTPVEYDPFTLTFSVQRGPFVFSRFGGLSIHENADGNIHAGGLLLSWLSVDGPDQLAMQAPGGEPFRLASVTVAELSFAAGMRLVVTGVDAAGAFTVELPFDLDGQTYDTFDLLAIEPRFSAVTLVTMRAESAIVDPLQYTYVVDRVVASLGSPTPGDVDCDGDVDLADLSVLLAAFGTCDGEAGYDPAADFDHSACIGLADLATLLGNFGT